MRWVFGVFAYLTRTSIRNRFAGMAKRIRSPRYAFALLFGGAYVVFFLSNLFRGPMTGDDLSRGPLESAQVESVATLGLFLLFMRWWLFGNDRSALAFSPAEIQFLFPAPVTRRALIQFKLLRAQLPIIVNAILWVLILRRGGTELSPVLRTISIWALFTIFMLHRLGATIVRTAAIEHGTTGARRNVIALALFGIAAAGLLWSAVNGYPAVRDASGMGEVVRSITAVMQQPVANALLTPFRILLAPTFARTAAEWGRDILPVLLIVAVHYVWVIRTELAFEDAAVEASAQRARRIEAIRARRGGGAKPVRAAGRTWIPLPGRGHPAVAILWKNILAFTRTPGQPMLMVMLAIMFGIPIVMLSISGKLAVTTVLGILALFLAAFSVLIGARFVRLDLRQDLVHLRVLRTYPIEGSALVAAEVAGSTLVLTIGQMLLLMFGHLMFLSQPDVGISVGLRWLILVAAPVALLILNATSVTIQNATALLFPAWVRIGPAKPGGVELLGQSILTTLASLLAFAVALLPPGIAAIAVFAGIQFVFQDALVAAAIAATIIGLGTLALEVGMAMMMLGDVFERGEMVESGTP